MTFTLLPYVFHNGQYTVNDWDLVKVWQTLEKDNLAKIIWWRGTVQNAIEFCAFCKTPTNFITFILDDKGAIRGAAWLNNIAQHTAYAHWLIIGKPSRAHITAGHEILDMWAQMGFKVIFGLIPISNVPGQNMLRLLDFTSMEPIPFMCHMVHRDGAKEAGILSYKILKTRRLDDG